MKIVNGKPMFFKNAAATGASKDYETLLAFNKPTKPVSGPVELSVLFVFPYKADEPKKNRKEGLIWKTTKPDTDNMVKLLKDSMTAVKFWEDDGQVCSETVRKAYGEPPRIEVFWRELPSLFLGSHQVFPLGVQASTDGGVSK
jgi:Holliday junction resolvase RusA-like endonuclease